MNLTEKLEIAQALVFVLLGAAADRGDGRRRALVWATAVGAGGCVLGLDHRIPNGTPLENYRFYIRKAWEIMDREAVR